MRDETSEKHLDNSQAYLQMVARRYRQAIGACTLGMRGIACSDIRRTKQIPQGNNHH